MAIEKRGAHAFAVATFASSNQACLVDESLETGLIDAEFLASDAEANPQALHVDSFLVWVKFHIVVVWESVSR